jgi:hypothetical protein
VQNIPLLRWIKLWNVLGKLTFGGNPGCMCTTPSFRAAATLSADVSLANFEPTFIVASPAAQKKRRGRKNENENEIRVAPAHAPQF